MRRDDITFMGLWRLSTRHSTILLHSNARNCMPCNAKRQREKQEMCVRFWLINRHKRGIKWLIRVKGFLFSLEATRGRNSEWFLPEDIIRFVETYLFTLQPENNYILVTSRSTCTSETIIWNSSKLRERSPTYLNWKRLFDACFRCHIDGQRGENHTIRHILRQKLKESLLCSRIITNFFPWRVVFD